jgi:hypothetical protein
MRKLILMVAVLGVAGCGDPSPAPMAATPESSRAVLASALDGWKQGKTSQDLSTQSPSLVFQDDDFTRGTKLLDYGIEGEGQARGTGYSYVVTLTLQDKPKKKVAYTAVSEPKHAVTREDRQP